MAPGLSERMATVEGDVGHIREHMGGKVDDIKDDVEGLKKEFTALNKKLSNGMTSAIFLNTQARLAGQWLLKTSLAGIIVLGLSGIATAAVVIIKYMP